MKDVKRKSFTILSSVVVQLLNRVKTLHVTPWTAACQASLCSTISQSFFKLMSIESWYHPTISSSVTLFSSSPQPFPASGSFPMSQLFSSGGQRIGASASASILLVNIQGWFPLELTHLIFLLSKGLSRVFSNITTQKQQLFGTQLSLQSNSHITTGKTIALTSWIFVGKVISPLFNMLPKLVIAFLSSSKRLLISWLQSPITMILEPHSPHTQNNNNNVSHCFHGFSFYLPWSDGTGCHGLSFF